MALKMLCAKCMVHILQHCLSPSCPWVTCETCGDLRIPKGIN